MKSFYMFRSNIKNLEYYHEYKDLETFEKKCHDFYLLQGLWILKNTDIDEVVIWRLTKKPKKDIPFEVDHNIFIQRWVNNFDEVFKDRKPFISFFRGGFKEYADIVNKNPNHFKTSLYLGASKRFFPAYGDKYDIILLEDESDFKPNFNCQPFYKTCNPNIFFPMDLHKNIDILWSHNLSQIRHKGAEFFVREISKSKFLKSLKIVHTGNKSKVLKKLCNKYNVTNIRSIGWVERPVLNQLLNKSKFALNTSNRVDGCPRISTEILCSGTPLLIRDKTRLLDYYKKKGVIEFNDNNVEKKIKGAFKEYDKHEKDILKVVNNELSMDNICRMNWNLWN